MPATAFRIKDTPAAEPHPWARAFVLLIPLGSFFFLSYGFANWVTSHRINVPSVAFRWEQWVPFLPWTIVPYWSSDVLFAASLLICTTRRELELHAKRLFAVQVISVICYLVFPLRCTLERPQTHGFFGWLFDVLSGFDKPFNQAPSLHVGLAVVLWVRFSAHLNGLWWFVTGAWLILAAISTMTTYQHQFIDLPAGLLAGWLTLALFPNPGMLPRSTQRKRLASFYLSGSVVIAASAIKIAGFGWILLWPAAALLLVAVAYAADIPEVFQKRNGVMNPVMALVAGPYIVAAWINARVWTRGLAASNEIADGVWLGRAPVWFDSADLNGEGPRMRSIVDVTAELPVHTSGVERQCVPMLDMVIPTRKQLSDAVAAIESFGTLRPTRVCCALEFSRSALTIGAWLVSSGRAASAEDALLTIRMRRPGIVVDHASQLLIQEFARSKENRVPGI